MECVTLRRLHSELHLKFVFPFHLLLVIIVCENSDGADHRIVRITALIPVVRDIILEELQRVVAAEGPEVRLHCDEIDSA